LEAGVSPRAQSPLASSTLGCEERFMQSPYFEDYAPDFRLRTSGRTVTETDLVNFIGLSGMFESLFVDTEYLKKQSRYSGRLVPGALVYAIAEGLAVQSGILHDRGLAFLGAELTVRAPTYVGDTIHVDILLVSKRETRHEDRGIVVTEHSVANQRDEEVMSAKITRMIRRRPR
jgi:acyl dehydratase